MRVGRGGAALQLKTRGVINCRGGAVLSEPRGRARSASPAPWVQHRGAVGPGRAPSPPSSGCHPPVPARSRCSALQEDGAGLGTKPAPERCPRQGEQPQEGEQRCLVCTGPPVVIQPRGGEQLCELG